MSEKMQTLETSQAKACKHKQGDTWNPGCCGDDIVQGSQDRVSDSSAKSAEDKLLPVDILQTGKT